MDPHTSLGRCVWMSAKEFLFMKKLRVKNLISNEFTVKFGLQYEVKKNGEKVVRILTIYPDLITFNSDSDDELYALLASINIEDLPTLDIADIPPLVCNMGKNLRNKKKPSKIYKMSYDSEGPSLTINRPRTQEELSQEEIEEDLYERIMLLYEKRPIIKTLKYSDKHKKILDSVLLD
ncbi:hypothetical protein Tco_1113231 [Tanacetum coccineum]|uniref:Uncharacterized protein n=1 Tax=Tanacetum coccineum TaxID=301880 RepID=A0ABQ5IUB8_9ASTR